MFDDYLGRSEVRRINWFCTDEDSCERVVTDEALTNLDELEDAAREAASSLRRYSELYNRLSQSVQSSSPSDQAEIRERLRRNRNVVRFAAEKCDLHGRFCQPSYVDAMEALIAQDYQKHE